MVYLTPDSNWSERVAESRHAEGEAAALLLEAGEAAAAARIVVEPYLIEVTLEGGSPRPVLYRERIRATGPSVDGATIREVA